MKEKTLIEKIEKISPYLTFALLIRDFVDWIKIGVGYFSVTQNKFSNE